MKRCTLIVALALIAEVIGSAPAWAQAQPDVSTEATDTTAASSPTELDAPTSPSEPKTSATPGEPAEKIDPQELARLRRQYQQKRSEQAIEQEEQLARNSGFAVELGTVGFSSQVNGGGITLGYKGDGFMLGVAMEYASQSVKTRDSETSTETMAFSPIVRLGLARVDRVELIGSLEGGLLAASVDTGDPDIGSVDATGYRFAAGPGLRIWMGERAAIGYQVLFQHSSISSGALNNSSPPFSSASSDKVTLSQTGLVGRLFLMGVF